jgi:hypothetical protein
MCRQLPGDTIGIFYVLGSGQLMVSDFRLHVTFVNILVRLYI